MTRKRRSRRKRRTQKGGAKPINPDFCKALPYLVNGLTYNVATAKYYTGQTTYTDYNSFLDATCKPTYVVSTVHNPAYTLKKSFILVKNHEKLSMLVQKWMKAIKPISIELFSSSMVGLRSNINPFTAFYDQLKEYNRLLENKKGMLTKLVTSNSEVMLTEDNIKDTCYSIDMKYKYLTGLPFNMKEFLGFEKMGGWMGTNRKQTMQEIDEEVNKLSTIKVEGHEKEFEKVTAEYALKTKASKTIVILASYVFCYLNYLPIPVNGHLENDTINRMIEVLNTLYGQINQFSGEKGKDGRTPDEARVFLQAFVDSFDTNLTELRKAMGHENKMKGGATTEVSVQPPTNLPEKAPENYTPSKGEVVMPYTSTNVENAKNALKNAQDAFEKKPDNILGVIVTSEQANLLAILNQRKKDVDAKLSNNTENMVLKKQKNEVAKEIETVVQAFEEWKKGNNWNDDWNKKGVKVDPNTEKAITTGLKLEKQQIEKQMKALLQKTNIDTIKNITDFTSENLKKINDSLEEEQKTEFNTLKESHETITEQIQASEQSAKVQESQLYTPIPSFEMTIAYLYRPDITDPLEEFYTKIQSPENNLDNLYKLVKGMEGNENKTFIELMAYLENSEYKKPVSKKMGGAAAAPEDGGGAAPAPEDEDGGGAAPAPEDGGGAAPAPAPEDGGGAAPAHEDGGGAAPAPEDGGGATTATTLAPDSAAPTPAPEDGGAPAAPQTAAGAATTATTLAPDSAHQAGAAPPAVPEQKNPLNEDLQKKVRIHIHFYMKPLYFMMKSFHKIITENEGMDIKMYKQVKADNKPTGRLSDLKEYVKKLARGQSIFTAYPKMKDDSGLKDYTYLRLYNTKEEKYMKTMFPMKQIEVDPTSLFMNTAYLKERGFVFVENAKTILGYPSYTYYYDEDEYRNGKILMRPKLLESSVPKAYQKIEEKKDQAPSYLPKVFTTKPKISKVTTNLLEAATPDETKIKELKPNQKVELEEKAKNQAIKQLGGGIVGKGVYMASGLVGAAISFVAIDVVYRGSVFLIFVIPYGLASVSQAMSESLSKEAFKKQDSEANERINACKKIVENVAMNWTKDEYNKRNETLLQVLSNMYSALDYIEKAEKSYRDIHEYNPTEIVPYIDGLLNLIKQDYYAFGKSKTFKMLNDQKKMLYMVYGILQKGHPKTLTDLKDELLGKEKKSTSEMDKKMAELETKLSAEKEKEKKDTTEIEKLTKQIEELKGKNKSFKNLDDELAEDPETLDKNEKPIKKLLKETRAIKFDTQEVEKVFENPKTFVFERNNSAVKIQLDEKTVLTPEVTILRPDPVPAIATLFLYRTDVDPDQKEKNEEAAAKAVVSKAKSDANAEVKKIKEQRDFEEKKIKKEQAFKLKEKKLEQKGQIDLSTLEGRTQLQLKEKEIEKEIKMIRETHKTQVKSSEMKYRQEMSRFSAETAQANKLSKDESKKELARIAEDKKRSDAQHKLEIDKINAELAISLENAKSGSKMSKMESEPGKNGYSTKNTTANRSNRNRSNTNTKKNVTMKNSNKTGKPGKDQVVCINDKCYNVEINGKKISINPMPQ
jgi:hypothetical protein